jgi:hypothetical protein
MMTLGRREKCLRKRSGKGHLRALGARRRRNRPLPAPLVAFMDQTRLKPCWKRPLGLHNELEPEVKMEIPVYRLATSRDADS